MLYKSINCNGIQCYFAEKKRKEKRVPFSFDIYYPNINNNINNINFSVDKPVLKAINISEGGMCFKSEIKIDRGDFISFLLKIDDNPSFACMSAVRWVGFLDNSYIIGCEFIKLELHQIMQIRSYILNKINKEK